MFKLIKDERGSLTPAFLPLTFLFFVITVSIVTISQAVLVNDIVLNKSVKIATRAAANQWYQDSLDYLYDTNTQDSATMPEIPAADALYAFESMLMSNLKLNEYLEAASYSPLEGQLNYILVVCTGNGINAIYTYSNGLFDVEKIPSGGFPETFRIKDHDLTFDTPGVFAIVEAKPKTIFKESKPYEHMAMYCLELQNGRVIPRKI